MTLWRLCAMSVFKKDSRVPKDLQTDLLKQALTAISFGAKHNSRGWPNDSGWLDQFGHCRHYQK
jgi:hypothetical protein